MVWACEEEMCKFPNMEVLEIDYGYMECKGTE